MERQPKPLLAWNQLKIQATSSHIRIHVAQTECEPWRNQRSFGAVEVPLIRLTDEAATKTANVISPTKRMKKSRPSASSAATKVAPTMCRSPDRAATAASQRGRTPVRQMTAAAEIAVSAN